MIEDPKLQLTRRDRDASLTLSKASSGLVARGLRDAIMLARPQRTDSSSEMLRLAEEGDPEAQYNVGMACYEGESVPQDYSEAVRWFRKAADQGDAGACVHLAFMYAKGQGVPQDYGVDPSAETAS